MQPRRNNESGGPDHREHDGSSAAFPIFRPELSIRQNYEFFHQKMLTMGGFGVILFKLTAEKLFQHYNHIYRVREIQK
ncbi:MAG: hypothetical protein DBX90_02495 [Lentisphaerae bacterium]|nr:MAG: hypothetical protein DBX90_11235 [Lentisphaerota bacterium]PWM86283.1 MAG: hypothetical protein DBX90_02495 [Lentisphaerota bacterium]